MLPPSFQEPLWEMAFCDGTWAVATDYSSVVTTTDFASWTTVDLSTELGGSLSQVIAEINCFEGNWILTDNSKILYSSDASSWSESTIPGSMTLIGGFGWHKETIWKAGAGGVVAYSTDNGATFTARTIGGLSDDYYDIGGAGTILVAGATGDSDQQ